MGMKTRLSTFSECKEIKVGLCALPQMTDPSLALMSISANCLQVAVRAMPKLFVERAKGDQRVEIRLMVNEGRSQKDILQTLQRVHGANALSKSSIQRWVSRIQNGGDLQDKARSGAPVLHTLRHQKAQQKLQENPKKSVRQLARDLNLSVGSTHKLLTKDMQLKKRMARWAPHHLNDNQKD